MESSKEFENAALQRAIGRREAFDDPTYPLLRDFTANNDPHGEHDFGSFEIGGQRR